jgi:hypothetical protein
MPRDVRRHLETNMVGDIIADFKILKLLGAGNTAVTYEVEDKYNVLWALKLVTAESYGERAPLREIARFSQVEDERFLVFPKEIGDWTLELNKQSFQFIWFKSRSVKGQTLKNYLESDIQFHAITEAQRCTEHLAVALEELARLGFAHGDMHDRNIMREVVGEKGGLPEVRYVVIDFSEAYPLSETQGGLQPDMQCFGHHLQAFADAIYRRETVSRDDEKVLHAIGHIPGLLQGVTAESIGIKKPSDVLKCFRDNMRAAEASPRKLRTPFDALSAEDIQNDALLTDLCFTKSWWAAELEKPGNVLLVGPRGCGKSMLFRRLRLKTKIVAKRDKELKEDLFVGFHLPCESLFFNRIADLNDALVDRNRDALIAFFNMAVAMEVASAIAMLPPFVTPISPRAAEAIQLLINEELGDLSRELNCVGSGCTLVDVAECAERTMRHIRRSIAFGQKLQLRAATDFVTRLVETVKREVPALAGRLFIFFLDDYTEERVPLALQKNLHPIVCQRSGEMCFKISAHMFGSIYSFPQPLALDEGRNIVIINLGSEYLKRNRKKAEGRALVQIMNERFKRCEGYDGTVTQWLGKTSFPGGKSLNRALHDKSTRSLVKYHGIQCLLELCTGDISEMIRMVGEIFREAGITSGAKPYEIDPSIQDRAIRNASRDFLARIRNIRPDGQQLYDVVDSFGKLSQLVLYERPLVGQGKDAKGRPRKDPYDLLTIYVDDLTKALPFARRVWERLQRASIFVDIRLAPSQRTVIADRVTMRRIYCPAFATTLTSSEHLQLSKEQFERLMDKPGEFCNDYLRRNVKDDQEQSLWDTVDKTSIEIADEEPPLTKLPDDRDRKEFVAVVPERFITAIGNLPPLVEIESAIQPESSYDLFLGAMGFEERTSAGIAALVRNNVRTKRALVLEFDLYQQATEKQRDNYEKLIGTLASGTVYRPVNAPVTSVDTVLPERLTDALLAASAGNRFSILFDSTSCPSRILSKCLRVLLNLSCDLTILYSEAANYYPTKAEWESGKLKPRGFKIEGPFSGVRFVEKPPSLQADDIGEAPVSLVLFPTFNTERTSGVLAEVEPAKRIWLIGEPHELPENDYRIEMAKAFAAPTMYPGDPWTLLTTFDYRQTMRVLAGIYTQDRVKHRIAIMPHGSKMQTLGVNLFALAHQVSMIFAMPKDYNPDRYSEGCRQVWAIPLGDTNTLKAKLQAGRAVGNGTR